MPNMFLKSPTHRVRVWALGEVAAELKGASDAKKQLAKLGAEFAAAQNGLTGLTYDDARRAYKATKAAVKRGEAKATEVLDWGTVKERFAAQRSAVREAMLKVSAQAKGIVADLYEAAAPKMPALAKRIHAQETAIAPDARGSEKSELVQAIEALETDFILQAKNLRTDAGITDPAQLLN